MTSEKKVLLAVSFGTSFNDNRARTIDAIEDQMRTTFPDWEVRRAFTSRIIIRKLAQRDNYDVDYITDAMQRLVLDGVRTVVVQPTHIMNGKEYDDVVKAVETYADSFDSLAIGKPLLTSRQDYLKVLDAIDRTLVRDADNAAGRDSCIVLMGHGTKHFANATYSQLQLELMFSGRDRIFVTTVEGFPEYSDTLQLMGDAPRKAVLFPFMLVAGDHANNDMAGDGEGTLRSFLESNGFEVHPVIKGLAEYPEFRELFMDHIRDAMARL